jgi:hypothetical protein
MSLSLTQSELRQRCSDVVARYAGLTQTAARDKVGGKTKAANDMLRSLIDEGVIVSQPGGLTGTAHHLYIKGKEPTQAPIIPWSQLPACKGCGINKVAGEAFNAEWGADLCSPDCGKGSHA